ncbi:MacB family efflux pump subunit [Methylovorus sp. MP688]|uniref:MacB family efflux pump subunit n=1 Tax=Methylovorus sp. (strain MP688) TaxID=887061 RepID=UPI0001EC43F4|nr:MacB family efflux pump subunit [Methylovorus sp. MP688]ADQ83629.1 putative ATP-binding/permease fusion ABC transporter [Methylovorus sp. MP688]
MSEAIPLIELRAIRKCYGGGDTPEVEVLRGISLSIHAGEFVAIVGASGSGKSTLMNLLGCLDRPTSGEYLFAGLDVAGLGADALAWLRREAFGFVFQGYHLIPTESARENVEMPAIYAGLPDAERAARAISLLQRLGLGDRLDHRPSQLSGGQQQRVSIARALMNGGRIILADEPTGALDSRSGEEVMALLNALADAGHTILLITHDREVAAQARRIIEVRDGQVVSDSQASGRDENSVSPSIVNATPAAASLLGSPQQLVEAMQQGSTASPVFWSDLREACRAAWRVMTINRFRTALTLLGIVIGVAAVIVMLAVGNGAKRNILSQISMFGSKNLYLEPQGESALQNGGRISLDDVAAVREIPNVLAAMPYLEGFYTARYDNRDFRTEIGGVTVEFPLTINWNVARGSFFNTTDENSMAKVVLLGTSVKKALFPDEVDPLGKYVLLNNIPFQVIGLLAEKGAGRGQQDEDNRVVIPYSTASSQIFGSPYPNWVAITLDDPALMHETEQAVDQLMMARHHIKDYRLFNAASFIKGQAKASDTMSLLLGLIAVVSLLVGGIGIMNIMLMTVRERTREIGIRMATGARQRDIMRQFLTEAMLVSLVGGAVGVVLGLLIGGVLVVAGVPIIFSISAILGAFGSAMLAGLIFGYTPAKKAAQLDPVVALASE